MAHLPLEHLQQIERILSEDAVVAACALLGEEEHAKTLLAVKEALDGIATPTVREVARDNHQNDELEIDDDAGTSPSDEGTWVQAWVWVAWPDCETCDGGGTDENDEPCPDCGGTGKGTIG